MEEQKEFHEEQTFGDSLREEREQAGLTLRDLARTSHLAASTLSRRENNKVTPSRTDVLKVDQGLSANGRLVAHWEIVTSVGFPPWMKNANRLEEAASLIELISPHLVPGLLQAPGYARVVFREGLHQGTSDEVDRLVALRCGRYKQLRDHSDPQIMTVFPVSALMCVPEVVRAEQVERLLVLMESERVNVYLLPEGTSLLGVASMLLMFHLGDGGQVAMSDHVDGATLYEDKRIYGRLHGLVKQALGSALPAKQSRKVLEDIR